MSKSQVAILRTSPATVLRDYHRLMNLAGYQDVVAEGRRHRAQDQHLLALLLPGQLDDAVAARRRHPRHEGGRLRSRPASTPATTARSSSTRTSASARTSSSTSSRRTACATSTSTRATRTGSTSGTPSATWTKQFLCLNEVYPDGFMIPRRFIGENIIHLPTVKTHVFTTTTGAMKNAFGGLLNERRHWTHPVIHETLVDLLMIQKKIHRGVFAVMDGTFAGDGPGPRCMVPHVKNVHPGQRRPGGHRRGGGEADGLRPALDIKFIRLAHELGLGCGDPRDIEIVGDADAASENWHFVGPFKKMTFASRMQHQIYWGPLKQADRVVAEDRARAVGLHRQRALPRQLLVPVQRRPPHAATCWTAPGDGSSRTGRGSPADANGFPTVGEAPAVAPRPACTRSGSPSASWAPASRKRRSLPAAGADATPAPGLRIFRMCEFPIRSESVDVEQIMKQIRAAHPREARRRLHRGADSRAGVRPAREVPRSEEPALRPARAVPQEPAGRGLDAAADGHLRVRRRHAVRNAPWIAAVDPAAAESAPEAVLQPEPAEPRPAPAGQPQSHTSCSRDPLPRSTARSGTRSTTRCCTTSCSRPRAWASR